MGLEFIEGNEAIARGALKANCDFFAGYPITPSSSILHHMLNKLPRVGGVAIQGEDEIASIGMCIGAAMAGAKALTATSGPGISLYSENIGLAIIGETPLVIVNVQRQGPATGAATKGAEGDILFTRWCTSGGQPMIVLSPATVSEAYELTYRAFNLAEQYRVPVFLLTNKEVCVTRESVDLERVELPQLVDRTRVTIGRPCLPYSFKELHEAPEFAAIGGDQITRFTTSSHDEAGYLTTSPEVIQRMIDHYAAKIESAEEDIALVKQDIEAYAETLMISYGITSRSVAVAVKKMREQGYKVSSLTVQSLYPVPTTTLSKALVGIKRVIVPEMNMGQYIQEIQRLIPAGVKVVGVNKMDTTLISPDEIIERGILS
ncbi:MAG TPA: 2-oxoacid:acceptor oxidoreductase subunit alpha [Arenicellales bacterium]|jgi:2-oxoglutarate ferredoxin oxidoreductase subunit alpha|nr:2-oxoacid:acceptor oxidoreductase subunit alpha [Arenicellales bacterium]HJL66333.1 2-oxoacid:acceptor oxidoreductase subunit alpha [Arenicellales bacterium]